MPRSAILERNVTDHHRACLQPPPGALGEALTLAQQPQVEMAGHVQVALCWRILSPPTGGRVVWHNGGTSGFRSFAGFAPDQSSAAVVLTNTTRSVDRLGLELTQGRESGAKTAP